MSKKDQIISKALEILSKNPQGLRYSEWTKMVINALPEMYANTIHGSIWDLDKTRPDLVFKPARGLWKLAKYKDNQQLSIPISVIKSAKIKEEDFYDPFAQWLVKEVEECTRAIVVGGNKFKDKWGTPDVLGIREPNKSDIIKHETEIVSAEIKLNQTGLIEAFGQICSYKLFSHKCYLVVPESSSEDDIAKLDSLALIFGIGLVLYNSENPKNPDFKIKTRPQKHEPDMFYVNKNLKLIESELFGS